MQSNKSNGQLTAQINMGDHKKSGFDLSNNVLGTGRIGRIIPTRALHVMPGDTIKADSKVAVQFEPLAVPILANMDVKQEHFYVPYNVVWKNWDKFISGGEKLDYNGVVPNATMHQYYYNAFSKLGVDLFKMSFLRTTTPVDPSDPQGETEPVVGILNINRWESLSAMRSQLDTIADTFQIKDILQPQYKVLDLLGKVDVTIYAEDLHGLSFILYEGTNFPNSEDRQASKEMLLSRYLEETGLTGNKYIEEITPFLYEAMDYRGLLFLPTPQGMDYLHLLYEYVKPFVGIGSNLDYLNMCRFTFSEYLANVILNLSIEYDDEYSSETTQYVTDLSIGIYGISQTPLSILNLRANYNIWYNNYRDILLEENAFEPYDGDNITADELFVLLVPRQRCWEKDAFTTALDNPGTGSIGVPVGSQYPAGGGYIIKTQEVDGDMRVNLDGSNMYEVSIGDEKWNLPTSFLSGINPKIVDEPDTFDFGFSLYQLDAAQRAQKWLQKALYFGNRISDFYYMRFGVRFLDARLRLPELLTSSSELVKLDVIMNNTNITTEANGEIFRSIAGDRAAYASAYDNGNSFDRFCEEHGVIMSYLTIMPQITYAYGINRDYSRLDQFDFAFAEFATLGMDAVYDTEITATSFALESEKAGAKVFGYQGRYYDYKAKHSEEHGELLDSQDMYTFSRKFNMFDPEGRPKLNYEFVHCFPSLDMFVVDDEFSDYFRYDIRHSTAAERELPAQSIYI